MGAKLKEVRERIKSVISTQQITKAMKMVSAAKLRRAQQAIVQLRPYSEKLNKMLRNVLSANDGDFDSIFNVDRDIKNVLVVIVTSNRGLAGALNANISKAAAALVREKYTNQLSSGNVSFLSIGRKGKEYVQRNFRNVQLIDRYTDAFSDLSSTSIGQISQFIMDEFANGKFDVVEIVYSRFKNAGVQNTVVERFIPVEKMPYEPGRKMRVDYIFEPGKEELLTSLVPKILQTQFLKTLLDTHASEHGARMTAMDKATENADNLLLELRINYNKARQEAITRELSEIVGGAAALDM